MEKQYSQLRVLRLFGMLEKEIIPVVRAAAADGCPGLQLGQRDGEYVVCIRASGKTQTEADQICDRWELRLSRELGPAVYGTGEKDLPHVTAETLAKRSRLMVAADEVTGFLLCRALESVEAGPAVFDFGSQSYAHPKKAERIQELPGWARKSPDPRLRLAGEALQALRVSGADYALTLIPPLDGHPAAAMLCTPEEGWLKALPTNAPPLVSTNWLLELARRRASGLEMPAGTQQFSLIGPGREIPVPVLEGQPLEEVPSEEEISAQSPAAEQAEEKPPEEFFETIREVVTRPPTPEEEEAAARAIRQSEEAARALYQDELPEPEEAPRRRTLHRLRIVLCVALVLLIAAAAALGVRMWQREQGTRDAGPDSQGYGTADFDAEAQAYLDSAQAENAAVAAYLALSGQPGTLVYIPGGSEAPAHGGAVLAAEPHTELSGTVACFSEQANLAARHHNALIYCPPSAMEGLAKLDQQEILKENCGFTLYRDDTAYRYKVAAVFYWDPAEQGETAFDLLHLQDLSNYNSYLEFVLGIKARSLYELAVDIEDGDSFATLLADSPAVKNGMLAVVGRRQREGENARLERNAVVSSIRPLYTASQYEQMNCPAPEMDELGDYWMNWYVTQGITASDTQEEQGMPEDDLSIDELIARIDAATAQAQQMAQATLSPVPVLPDSDGQGSLPQSDVPLPTRSPTEVPAPQLPESQSEGRHDGPDIEGGSTAPTVTLNVTMNGTQQTMDVVECLAMIAQNELGYNQPAEAYKAQAVAAHSWILTQGSYPAVSGRVPTEEVRQAAAEVANLVLTYQGSVAFTPYFASAAYGTCPSTEVWGGARPYLVAVDSPYDKDYARHWQTTREYTRDEVQSRVSERLGIDLNAISEDPASWLGDLEKNSSGYVLRLRVGDTVITGGKLRTGVLNDVNGKTMRSSAFDVAYDAERQVFVFTVLGYGHGCGLSQMGAVGYADHGASYQEILAHYYPGTQLTPI